MPDGTSTDRPKTIMVRLKEETKSLHAKLEALPFFKALMEHKLPLECYVGQLRALAIIHGVLEHETATSEDERVASVWDDNLRKLPLLEDDLKFFQPRIASDDPPSIEAALSMTEKIRLRSIENPATLLGYLYVFEGSTLGNNMHRPDISATYRLDALKGCRYYSSYQDQVGSNWTRFSERMNTALEDRSLHDPLIESAHEAFRGLETLYGTLSPLDEKEQTFHVARFNPEAGNHPIPDDEREIQAALKASDRGWAEFSYYQERYGERGKRFSDSDTCWLVTLSRLDQESLQGQIDWLGRLLATRGMPQIMLEQTLRFLHEELVNAVPEQTAIYEKLLKSADTLRAARDKVMSEETLQALSGQFDETVGPEMAEKHRNTGKLLVSAVADEKNGIEGAVSALKEWATDGSRFSGEWIAAVNRVIDEAGKADK